MDQRLIEAIDHEIIYQDRKWGDSAQRPHEIPGWLLIVRGELEEAEHAWRKGFDDQALCELLQAIVAGIRGLREHGVVTRDDLFRLSRE